MLLRRMGNFCGLPGWLGGGPSTRAGGLIVRLYKAKKIAFQQREITAKILFKQAKIDYDGTTNCWVITLDIQEMDMIVNSCCPENCLQKHGSLCDRCNRYKAFIHKICVHLTPMFPEDYIVEDVRGEPSNTPKTVTTQRGRTLGQQIGADGTCQFTAQVSKTISVKSLTFGWGSASLVKPSVNLIWKVNHWDNGEKFKLGITSLKDLELPITPWHEHISRGTFEKVPVRGKWVVQRKKRPELQHLKFKVRVTAHIAMWTKPLRFFNMLLESSPITEVFNLTMK